MMKKLLVKYGQEFYPDQERELIAHGGAIQSSSAYLSVSLKTGAVIAIMSDQPNMAFSLHKEYKKISLQIRALISRILKWPIVSLVEVIPPEKVKK